MSDTNEVKRISDLIPDAGNYNKGTEKGRKLIGKSLKKLGAGRSILIDKDGNVIAGNKTLEGAAAAGIDEVIVVKTTGRQIVAVQRTDLEIGSKKGREMALADNATGAANLSWDLEAMTADGWTDKDLEGWGVEAIEGETRTAQSGFRSLQEVFIVPPFSILDTRAGYWQDRKRAWLAKGIKSEQGRGDNDRGLTFGITKAQIQNLSKTNRD